MDNYDRIRHKNLAADIRLLKKLQKDNSLPVKAIHGIEEGLLTVSRDYSCGTAE